MKKINYLILLFFTIITQNYCLGQSDSSILKLKKTKRSVVNYIPIKSHNSYRLNSSAFENKNKRFVFIKNKIVFETLYENGKVATRVECKILIDSTVTIFSTGKTLVDSIKKSSVDPVFLGADSFVSSNIIITHLYPTSHGKYSEFYESGKKSIAGHYSLGAKDGTWKFYNVDGELVKKEKWAKGKLLKTRMK